MSGRAATRISKKITDIAHTWQIPPQSRHLRPQGGKGAPILLISRLFVSKRQIGEGDKLALQGRVPSAFA